MAHQIKTNKILNALRTDGKTPQQVATQFDVSLRYIYELISRYPDTPTNRPIVSGTKYEGQLVRALVVNNLDVNTVAYLFNQAPVAVARHLKLLQKSAAPAHIVKSK